MGSPSWVFALLLCAALTEVAVGPKVPPPTKKMLPATEAKTRWLNHKKLKKCTVAPRVLAEHFTHFNSANQALAAAKDRFERNHNIAKTKKQKEISGRLNLVPLSWTDVTEAQLQNKALGAAPASKIDKASVRTVEVTEVTAAAAANMKNVEKDYHKDQRRELFIHFEGRDLANNMYITGSWEPRTGSCELYHYEANPPAGDAMLDEYRKFHVAENGQVTTPVTKPEL